LINTQIGSTVNQEGYYTTGNNTTGTQATDTITVVDHANLDISGTATIRVDPEEIVKLINVFPEVLLGSRWIPLPYLLIVTSEDAMFELTSKVSFEPGDDITPLLQVGFGNIFFSLVILNANPDEGTVTVTISTGEEIAVGEISILLLPCGLNEKEKGAYWF
jgi:hypothetical protein